MVVFIDESGTHKDVDNSVIALVYVEIGNLEIFEKSVVNIEKDLKISHFHWTEERWKTREQFVIRLLDLDFKFKAAILKNPIRLSEKLEDVMGHLIKEKNIRNIVIDGKKPKWVEQKLKSALRYRGVTVGKLKTVRKDESSPGLRVADCLAGLTRYFWDKPESEAKNLYKKLKRKDKLIFELIA